MMEVSKLDSLWLPDIGAVFVAEPDGGLLAHGWHWTERHLQCVWADNKLRPAQMRSGSGEEVAVADPGRWNLEAGPDFLDAVVTVGGKTMFTCVDGPDFDAHQVDWDELKSRKAFYFEQESKDREAALAGGNS